MLSVGIDIGTSTTKMAASSLTLENLASFSAAPQIRFTSKKVIYRGAIHITPLIMESVINCDEIVKIIETEYLKAGINAADVETGAVIITGEAAKRENARAVVERLSGLAGDFVVSTAGPDLESLLSGKGSGAQEFSKKEAVAVVNFDIGGGTTNISLFDKGKAVGCACLDIGGRLVRFKEGSRVPEYIAPKIQELANLHNIVVTVGTEISCQTGAKLVGIMAQAIYDFINGEEAVRFLVSPESGRLPEGIRADFISFSGGVGSCYYNTDIDSEVFSDIGAELAEALRENELTKKFKVFEPDETARATVIGAGCHTTQISGGTISFNRDIFPIRNLPVINLKSTSPGVIKESLAWALKQYDQENAAIAWPGEKNPGFEYVQALANSLIEGTKEILDKGLPLIVLVSHDFAKALGQTLNYRLGGKNPVVCLDTIDFANADYIDLGRPLFDGAVIPVIIKTLIFAQERGDIA